MWIAVVNNLPELFGFICAGVVGYLAGVRVGRWRKTQEK